MRMCYRDFLIGWCHESDKVVVNVNVLFEENSTTVFFYSHHFFPQTLFDCCTYRCRNKLKCFLEVILKNRRLDRMLRKAKHKHCGYKRNSECLLGIKCGNSLN